MGSFAPFWVATIVTGGAAIGLVWVYRKEISSARIWAHEWLLSYRKRIKALEADAEKMREAQERSDRRMEDVERLLVAARVQTIVVQLHDGSQRTSELGESFKGEAIVHKRRSTLEDDFKAAPGAGKIAAHLILQEDDVSEAERILNIFESQPERIDEAYPYVAFATKLAEQDEMMQAHDALSRLPDSAQWQVGKAIEWALSVLGGKDHETDAR